MNPRTLSDAQRTELRRPYGGIEATITDKKGRFVVYLVPGVIAVAYVGKAVKASFRYRFRSGQHRMDYIARWAKDLTSSMDAREAARKAEQAKPHTLQVGDVLRSSWGHEQTNVDYYEVTALIGARMVEIREIARKSADTGHLTGECVPAPGRYIGEPMRKVARDAGVRIASYAGAYRIEPIATVGEAKVFRADHWSAYH